MHEKEDVIRKPTIVLPYTDSSGREDEKDLFIYLRPETNGIQVESLLFSVIHNEPLFNEKISLVYLANISVMSRLIGPKPNLN